MKWKARSALSMAFASAWFPCGAFAAVCDGISPASDTPLTTVFVWGGFLRPIFVTAPPGDVNRIFIPDQDGRIWIIKNGVRLGSPFLDISPLTLSPDDPGGGDEEGLLGLAFHLSYASNGWFFVYHTDGTGANNVIARYARSSTDPDLADPSTRQQVISFPHPSFNNHNGGMIAFAPDDGLLYVGTGDGGGGCDNFDNAQSDTSNLGKILRINVDSLPYTIPPDNPFVGPGGPNDEIWSKGVRNPWRFSFDRLNADLYIGDVGQNEWEEVDYRTGPSPGGENYGWDLFEGTHCPPPTCTTPDCGAISNHVLPVVEYQHVGGACAVTGGYVYRGCRMPNLRGSYFYGDFCAGSINSFRMVSGSVTNPQDRTGELAPGGGFSINYVSSFGEDARGEIYIVDYDGEVYKIVPILSNLQVSGPGASSLALDSPDWTWEDLHATSSHPLTQYRVYRSAGNGGGAFDCVFQNATSVWPGGDPDLPSLGGLFSYLVTALNASGQQTSPGTRSDGTPRTLSNLPCPP